jgi:pimeloyl-ACP methyl ester carboxylesterase
MDFYDVLDRVVDLLRSRGRVSYRALKRQFGLDDAYLEDRKDELIKSQRLAVDEDSEVLVWTGNLASAPAAAPVTDQEHTRLAHTPKHLAEKILTSRSALEGERKQVTVLFADLKASMELLADRDPEEDRPEYQHGWGSKTYYTQLGLDPLPPESADEFLQVLLGDDLSLTPLKELLIERTEGNPFFLEESVRVLVETEVLVGERGVYRLAQALSSIQVPATVQAVLGTVSVPTLVMHGTEDRNVLLEVGRHLAEHIPEAQFYAFTGRGHVPVSTATAEFCDVLRCFVRTGNVSATSGAAP